MRISPKILGLNVGMLKCWDCFWQSMIVVRISFGLETDVFEFRCAFWCLGLFLAQDGNGKVD